MIAVCPKVASGLTPKESIAQVKRLVASFNWTNLDLVRDDAESVASLAYWTALANGKDPKYAHACARNEILRLLRMHKRNRPHYVINDRDGMDIPAEDTCDARLRVAFSAMAISVRKLPWFAQACLSLRIMKRESIPRIAAALTIEETTVRRTLRAAEKKIREDVKAAWSRESLH